MYIQKYICNMFTHKHIETLANTGSLLKMFINEKLIFVDNSCKPAVKECDRERQGDAVIHLLLLEGKGGSR